MASGPSKGFIPSIWDDEFPLERIKKLKGVKDWWSHNDLCKDLRIRVNADEAESILCLVKRPPQTGKITYNKIYYMELEELENITVVYSNDKTINLSIWTE